LKLEADTIDIVTVAAVVILAGLALIYGSKILAAVGGAVASLCAARDRTKSDTPLEGAPEADQDPTTSSDTEAVADDMADLEEPTGDSLADSLEQQADFLRDARSTDE